jgi:hypothetical protein
MSKPIGRGWFHEKPPVEEQIDLKPTERQARWLRFLLLHGPLPSSFLFALEGEKSATELRSAQLPLRRLWQGGFIIRPHQQRETENSNYNEYVYDLSEQGRRYLRDQGHWIDTVRPTGPWVHQLFVATVTATADIFCQREGYRYIPPHEYLGEQPATAKVPFHWDGKAITLSLAPDAVFAIDYGKSFIAYALEADRDTEISTPRSRNNPYRKSDLRSVRQYVQFIGQKQYKTAYGRSAMMVLLFITANETRKARFLDVVAGEMSPCSFIAAGVVPEFGKPWKPPRPLFHLFDQPLDRAGKDGFVIKKPA